MKKILWLLTGSGVFVLALTGCTKDPLNNMTDEESRIYITGQDSTVNFSDYKTYSISDSVTLISNGNAKRELNATDQAYIDAVKKYMNQAGYQLVAKNASPDLGMDVSRIINTSTGVISYGDYWNYYNNYWDPYYWGYPGYGYYIPYVYSVYQIREGAVSIDMLDLKNAVNKDKISVIWSGLIRGEGIFNAANADSQVLALFVQSPYLHQ